MPKSTDSSVEQTTFELNNLNYIDTFIHHSVRVSEMIYYASSGAFKLYQLN